LLSQVEAGAVVLMKLTLLAVAAVLVDIEQV